MSVCVCGAIHNHDMNLGYVQIWKNNKSRKQTFSKDNQDIELQ